jgi:nuclear transport factor 2 (NTF2) superfamily protein
MLLTGQCSIKKKFCESSNLVMYAMLKQIHGATVGANQQDLKLLIQNKYYVIPTLDNDRVLEGAKVTAHRKTDEDNSLAQKKTKSDFDSDLDIDKEETGNFVKNFIAKNKDEIKMIYNFHDGT